MSRGGLRPGAGRPAGSKNQRSRSVEERIERSGVDPIDALLEIGQEARDSGDLGLAVNVYKEVARYLYPSKKSVDVTVGDAKSTVFHVITGISRTPVDPLPA
jgi:hypothetical protein